MDFAADKVVDIVVAGKVVDIVVEGKVVVDKVVDTVVAVEELHQAAKVAEMVHLVLHYNYANWGCTRFVAEGQLLFVNRFYYSYRFYYHIEIYMQWKCFAALVVWMKLT
mmetsp:Transcript_7301/g.9253  ORF Transcript_7301/g.9253 Transcript_7301/m.9253 type:complete len:109 (+) Transcript_7301:506-832(+)